MTDTASSKQRNALSAEMIVMAVAVLLIVVALWFALAQRQQALRSSPAGFDGLQAWLVSQSVGAQSFSGGWLIDESSIGLLVVPIFDTALDEKRTLPQTKQELLLQQDEYDLVTGPVLEKAASVPTLMILPKWRTGLRLTGLGHPVLLVKQDGPEAILRRIIGDSQARVGVARTPFTEFRYEAEDEDLSAKIYAAQMFTSKGCRPIIGRADAMLLADCPLASGKGRVLILSDPDLLNNHGLRLGDNAYIARDLLAQKAGAQNVLIDYSRDNWLRGEENTIERERTWSDLLRFFDPPFRVLWVGVVLAFALALWRSSLRFGPAIAERLRPGASKSLAVASRARLMRLAGQDGALVKEYAKARIGVVAGQLFGVEHARHYANEDAFIGYVERRHNRYAGPLAAVLEAINALPSRANATQAIRHVDDLEHILEQITDDT